MTPEEKAKVQRVTDKLDNSRHKQWITEFAENLDRDYDWLMSELDNAVAQGGESIYTGDRQIDFPNELWEHYAAMRNGQVSKKVKENTWFSCAC